MADEVLGITVEEKTVSKTAIQDPEALEMQLKAQRKAHQKIADMDAHVKAGLRDPPEPEPKEPEDPDAPDPIEQENNRLIMTQTVEDLFGLASDATGCPSFKCVPGEAEKWTHCIEYQLGGRLDGKWLNRIMLLALVYRKIAGFAKFKRTQHDQQQQPAAGVNNGNGQGN